MIEEGTDQEIKDNVLSHLTWKPDVKNVIQAQVSFVQEADKNAVVVAELTEFEIKRTPGRHLGEVVDTTYPVVRVEFESKRERGAVVAKSIRAARRARLVLYRLESNGQPNKYTAYLRADE